MATGWAGDGAVQEQIDASIKDGIRRARSSLSRGPSLSHCQHCGAIIPEARRVALRGVRLCVSCQLIDENVEGQSNGYARRGITHSQPR